MKHPVCIMKINTRYTKEKDQSPITTTTISPKQKGTGAACKSGVAGDPRNVHFFNSGCGIKASNNKKFSYRRETARQLPTEGGLGPPASAPSGHTYAYGRVRNPQQTYVKRAVH